MLALFLCSFFGVCGYSKQFYVWESLRSVFFGEFLEYWFTIDSFEGWYFYLEIYCCEKREVYALSYFSDWLLICSFQNLLHNFNWSFKYFKRRIFSHLEDWFVIWTHDCLRKDHQDEMIGIRFWIWSRFYVYLLKCLTRKVFPWFWGSFGSWYCWFR